MSEQSEQVVVRLTPELLSALKADAATNERTVSQTVRWAIRCYLAPPPATTEGEPE